MRSGALRTLTLAAIVLVTTATVASAQMPIRIRGTIAKVLAALSDIKAGAFLGAAALPEPS